MVVPGDVAGTLCIVVTEENARLLPPRSATTIGSGGSRNPEEYSLAPVESSGRRAMDDAGRPKRPAQHHLVELAPVHGQQR
jgi:hypothetical protein